MLIFIFFLQILFFNVKYRGLLFLRFEMVQKLQNSHHFITLPKGFSFRVDQADGQVPRV